MPCVRLIRGVPAALFHQRAGAGRPHAARGLRRTRGGWAVRLSAVPGAVLGLLPAWALACPTCVERAPESTGRSALLLGAMLLVPFLLVAVGAWAAIRAARGDAKRSS
jgi:hypothetical protein